MVQTLGLSQRDTWRGGYGDCLRSVPRPLVTVAPMNLGCRGTTMYLEQLHYLARANMQSGLLTKCQTISNDRLALL